MTAQPTSKTLMARWKIPAVFLVGVLFGVLCTVEIVPRARLDGGLTGDATGSDLGLGTDSSVPIDVAGNGGKGKSKGKDQAGPAAEVAGATTAPVAGVLPPSKPGLQCAPGKNGGSTDRGVTGTEIKMATTVVDSGPGAAFLRDVRFAMEAVRNKVNAAGGICGRKLSIQYTDDGWDAARGAQYLRNFIQQGTFAIPVGPSSEGLRVVIASGDIDKAKVPVVGADGLLIDQYQKPGGRAQPWVWPVATATVASARIMVQEAYKRGARKADDFSIVFDSNYRFGVEGARAFNAEVKRLTGKSVDGFNPNNNCQESYCGISAGRNSYSGEVANFKEGNFIALFLDPISALAWMRDPNTPEPAEVKYGYGAAQPLFTRGFAVNCKDKCHGMKVWTGFKPPIEGYKNDPVVKQYVTDLKRTKPDADEFNAFAQGGYSGMMLLVEALKKVGPELTRERLKVALDGIAISSTLSLQKRLAFSPTNRYANTTMQAFAIQHRGTFGGWRSGPIVSDPRPAAGIG